jgi:hypothetical protein
LMSQQTISELVRNCLNIYQGVECSTIDSQHLDADTI